MSELTHLYYQQVIHSVLFGLGAVVMLVAGWLGKEGAFIWAAVYLCLCAFSGWMARQCSVELARLVNDTREV